MSKNINLPPFFSLRDITQHHLCKSILSYKKSLESLSVLPKERTSDWNDFRALPVVY